jgi:hypothetical protein
MEPSTRDPGRAVEGSRRTPPPPSRSFAMEFSSPPLLVAPCVGEAGTEGAARAGEAAGAGPGQLNIVRRQAAETLRCMHALVRQARCGAVHARVQAAAHPVSGGWPLAACPGCLHAAGRRLAAGCMPLAGAVRLAAGCMPRLPACLWPAPGGCMPLCIYQNAYINIYNCK